MKDYLIEIKNKNFGLSRSAFIEKFYNHFKNSDKYINVLETGCNYAHGYGFTNVLAHIFQNYLKGEITTIDISYKNILICKNKNKIYSDVINYICGDSISIINSLSDDYIKSIDLFILDSYDLHLFNPDPSSIHHLKELLSFINRLDNKAWIAIDDNYLPNTSIQWNWDHGGSEIFETKEKIIGKGAYCDNFLLQNGWIKDDSILFYGQNNVFLYQKC